MPDVKEVEDLLENYFESEDHGEGWYGWRELSYFNNTSGTDVPGLGSVTVIDGFGGEGQGDHAHMVFLVVDDRGFVRHYKKDGFYASHYGTDWDGEFYEVKPTAVEAIEYIRVKGSN
jgi:hypothetical protein